MRRAAACALSLVVLVGPSCRTAAPSVTTSAAFPRLWIITGGWFDRARYEDRPLALELFRRPPSLILGAYHLRSGGAGRPDPRTWIDAFSWPSLRHFRSIARGSRGFLAAMTAAMYDPEAWDATPLRERKDPVGSFESFARLARSRVETVAIAPHPNLTLVPGARCGSNGGSIYEAYLRCRLAAEAARSADIVVVQAQALESEPVTYRAFVRAAAAQARAVDGDVRVVASLSATGDVTADQLLAAWTSVRDVVDGYYVALERRSNRFGVVIAFLRRLPLPDDV
jgi:hypothetical protein